MANIQPIDEYQAVGNSLPIINDNFANINTRLCIYDDMQSSFDELFSTLQTVNTTFANFYTATTTLSAGFQDMSDIVYNVNGYWHNTLTLMYQNTFAVMANYEEILSWLQTNFTYFSDDQLVRVHYTVKSYDPKLLDGQTLANITIATLNSLASTYSQKTEDIQRYIILDNHVSSIISTISNIFIKLFINTKIQSTDDLDLLVNSFSIHKNVISSPILINVPYNKILSIWALLEQYEILKDEYSSLKTLGISSIPSNILSIFNTKSVSSTFVGSFCFRWKDSNWNYSPSCANDVCVQIVDCYNTLDVNKLYTNSECTASPRFILYPCDKITLPNTLLIYPYAGTQTADTTCPLNVDGFNLRWGGFFQPQTHVFTVPVGAVAMIVRIWGNSGSSDFATRLPGHDAPDGSQWWNEPIMYGGGGGYSSGTFNVTEGDAYTVLLGGFGGNQKTLSCTGDADISMFGGGLNGIFTGSAPILPTSYNRALVIAGGGGGANCTFDANHAHGEPGNANVFAGFDSTLITTTMQGTNAGGFRDLAEESYEITEHIYDLMGNYAAARQIQIDNNVGPYQDITQDFPGCGGGYRGGKSAGVTSYPDGNWIVNTHGGRGGTGYVRNDAINVVMLPGDKSTSTVKTYDRGLGLAADLTANKYDVQGYYAQYSKRVYANAWGNNANIHPQPNTDSLRYSTGVAVIEFIYDSNFVE